MTTQVDENRAYTVVRKPSAESDEGSLFICNAMKNDNPVHTVPRSRLSWFDDPHVEFDAVIGARYSNVFGDVVGDRTISARS